ncbi:MAG TPA: asparagine synthase (glutamine-hydrolyzing) [Vicinamibacterales bacterium]|nr:asparagine synthase (glutamine-hydrolyzing) [Vicinamibacterales bacterium]
MCGIVGVAGDVTVSRDLLVAMRDELRHRGPDDEGVWWSPDNRVGFGHRRLAIIDLSPAGRQPMSDAAGALQIVFNGEIYNYLELRKELEGVGHRFRTATDTEVILEAYLEWGRDCLPRLNGMFALALFDSREQQLLLARDPAGEKPLFYRHHGGAICFASEVKALLADPSCPRELDVASLDYYLAFGYVPGERCLFHGIRKLPQGHALTFDVRSGSARTWPYWSLPAPAPFAGSDEDLVDELERLLSDSIRLRLIADVPVGIMLSGGVDSSLVAALAARVSSRRIKTFNISFPGHGAFDESPYARSVARHFDTEHVELAAEPATVDLLPQLARQFDEPIADSSMVPTYLVSKLIRKEATVALGGDGGDELFGGYFQYSWVQQQARIGRWMPRPAQRAARSAVTRLLPVGTTGRNYLLGLTAGHPLNIVQFNVVFDADARRRLMTPLGELPHPAGAPEAFKAALCADRATPLQQATALDFRTYMVDDILAKVDRASMLCSLEVRAPFLDARVIDLAFGRVPDRLRATSRERKILSRRLAERILPPDLDLTRKHGFSLPLPKWFKGDWGRFIEDVLTAPQADLFDRQIVRQLLAGQKMGLSNTHRLFALTMIELWRREYGVATVSRPEAAPIHQPA